MYTTPVTDYFLDSLSIKIKHDGLLPPVGGGNKGRKNQLIFDWLEQHDFNAVVTTGGAQSNHARVVAIMSAQRGWPCHLILHGDNESLSKPSGNLLLMLMAGAKVTIVQPDQISHTIANEMENLAAAGLRPFSIPGGAHHWLGAKAYVNAIEELVSQTENWFPDYIILASGTGTTQAGLVAGIDKLCLKTQVIGISVARRQPRGHDIIKQSYEEIRNHLNILTPPGEIIFKDDWVGEGYEKPQPETLNIINRCAKNGLFLDPTYTGKAFYGMSQMIKSGEIESNKNILFWHTGGLMNLLSSSYLKKII